MRACVVACSIGDRYRFGGAFPDVQMTFADVVVPLQELCRRDTVIAAEVFKSFFTTYLSVENDDDDDDDDDDHSLTPATFGAMAHVLRSSSSNNAVVSTLFQVCALCACALCVCFVRVLCALCVQGVLCVVGGG